MYMHVVVNAFLFDKSAFRHVDKVIQIKYCVDACLTTRVACMYLKNVAL